MLTSRCSLITGSVAGLGFAVAQNLARNGSNVILNALCPAEEGHAAAERLAAATGAGVVFDSADLRDVSQIERMMADAAARFGRVDILVNNAVVRNFSRIEAMTADQWNTSLAVNLSATFHLSRLALPAMRANGWGRIINISSIYGLRATTERIDYITTKTALLGLTRAIAVETADAGITCNALCPGTILTEAISSRIHAIAADKGMPVTEVMENFSSRHPTGRFVDLDHVGALVSFLCSPAGRDITGATLPIDGGWQAG